MKKLVALMIVIFLCGSVIGVAQDKSKLKSSTTTTTTKVTDKADQGDKVVKDKKGPDGQVVYEGSKGGQYYLNKSGNKTYLKDDSNVVQGKKGPNGETVYAGPKGGQYYLNKSGDKVYLTPEKK
jgi:colicin import membrane protein